MIAMSKPLATLVAALLTQLAACSTFDAYHKCGFGGCPGDKETTAQVEAALREAPGISYWTVDVQTLDHVVYLHGIVDTNPERARIEEVAMQASGGDKVVNSIELRNFRD